MYLYILKLFNLFVFHTCQSFLFWTVFQLGYLTFFCVLSFTKFSPFLEMMVVFRYCCTWFDLWLVSVFSITLL